MVTYRPTEHRGTGVDTFTASYVLPRADVDLSLDRQVTGLHGLVRRQAS
jgi:hypothetical protein